MSRLRHILVTGTSPESVFEIAMLLNEHPHMLMGMERFSRLNGLADRFLLAPERLIRPLSNETNIRGELLYARLQERLDAGKVAVTGDADARYVKELPRVAMRLGVWRLIAVVDEAPRDSFEVWRDTLSDVRVAAHRWFAGRILVLPYGAFTAGDPRWLDALLGFTALPPADRVDDAYNRLRAQASRSSERDGSTRDAKELTDWVRARSAEELSRHRRAHHPDTRVSQPTLTTEELRTRDREREQLRVERHDGSTWPDERWLLQRRYQQQAQETVGRGVRIAELGLTAAMSFPSAQLRIAIVSPPDRTYELGRLHCVYRLALSLGRLCAVRLFAPSPPQLELRDVELHTTSSVTPDVCGDCDLVLCPADLPDAAALAGELPTIVWLDGFAAPDDPHVATNLRAARLVLAGSRLLCELTRHHGAPAIHFPLGLDRSAFPPGPSNDTRGILVTAVAQAPAHFEWPVLSEAMVRVRESRPDVEVTVVGGVPIDGATAFLHHPTIAATSQTLRASAVHVTSARSEGFNFLGAMALASGAALVTTDTGGSHDFAVHNRTALVAPIGDPDTLAEHVLTLLADSDLRNRLVDEGGNHVRTLLRPWPEVARSLAVLLTDRL